MSDSHRRNHYVPQWYQKRFLPDYLERRRFHYLDLQPEPVVTDTGHRYLRTNPVSWGTNRCFVEKDLYTRSAGEKISTEIERFYSDHVETRGPDSFKFFDDQDWSEDGEARMRAFVMHMSTQKLRTPKGLRLLRDQLYDMPDKEPRDAMMDMLGVFGGIWVESVWAVVNAYQSDVKFLLSDHPVTVYNSGYDYPLNRTERNHNDPKIGQL